MGGRMRMTATSAVAVMMSRRVLIGGLAFCVLLL